MGYIYNLNPGFKTRLELIGGKTNNVISISEQFYEEMPCLRHVLHIHSTTNIFIKGRNLFCKFSCLQTVESQSRISP